VATIAHREFFNFIAEQAQQRIAEVLGKPLRPDFIDPRNISDFMKYIGKIGIRTGNASLIPRLLSAMERAGLHREKLPHVQARPGCPPDLSPHPRFHRGPPDDRVRRPSRIPLDRTPNRLEHQEIRPQYTPL
jgi:hypothetical protein